MNMENYQNEIVQDTQPEEHLEEHLEEEEEDLLNGLDKIREEETQLSTTLSKPDDVMNILSRITEQTSQNMNALNSMVIKIGLKMNDDIINMGMKIDSAVGQMDRKLESEMEKMRSELNKLKSVEKDISIFNSDVGRVLWNKIPLFFDTEKGLYSWFPVNFTDTNGEDHDVVVLSVPMTVYLMQTFDGMNNTKFKRDVENHLRTLDRFQLIVNERNENFSRIMKKTPFKPYSMYTGTSTKKRPISFKNNSDNYIVMDTKYWKDMLSSVEETFPGRPKSIPDSTKPLHKNVMAQQYALKSVSVNDTKTPELRPYGDIQFDYEERSSWPSMGFPIWREAYDDVQKFFGFSSFHHVRNGVLDLESDECITFEDTLSGIDDCDKYENEEEPEQEQVVGNKRSREEDWSEEY